jgi:hypothetical protein
MDHPSICASAIASAIGPRIGSPWTKHSRAARLLVKLGAWLWAVARLRL